MCDEARTEKLRDEEIRPAFPNTPAEKCLLNRACLKNSCRGNRKRGKTGFEEFHKDFGLMLMPTGG
jgi:hypothetical protein